MRYSLLIYTSEVQDAQASQEEQGAIMAAYNAFGERYKGKIVDVVLGVYHLYHATRADLPRRAGRRAEAAESYARAPARSQNRIERRFLQRRLREMDEPAR